MSDFKTLQLYLRVPTSKEREGKGRKGREKRGEGRGGEGGERPYAPSVANSWLRHWMTV